MLKLLIEDGDGKSKLAPINPDNAEGITIGRKEGNTIRLKERNVSRNHARIFSTPEGVFIEPVAARYGLKVNSKKIEGRTKLGFGDEVRIGDYHLYIQDENSQPAKPEETGIIDLTPEQQPKFVVITSNFSGNEYPITKSEVTIGRAATNNIRIDHVSISSLQAKITRNRRGEFSIENLSKTNHTKVNGEEIAGPRLLSSGDTVVFGHVGVRYCAPGELWYLRLRDDDFGYRSAGMSTGAVVGIVAIVVVICALIATVLFLAMGKDSDNSQVTNNSGEEAASRKLDMQLQDMKNSLHMCKRYMVDGDFDKARYECERAESFAPDDDDVRETISSLRKEESSMREYEHIKQLLDEGSCQDALGELEMLSSKSYASKLAREDRLEDKAVACRDRGLVRLFEEHIENSDFAEAKNALETLERAGTYDESRLDRMKSELERKSGAGSRRSGGGGGRSAEPAAPAAPAPVAPPAPVAAGEDAVAINSVDEALKAIMKCKKDKKTCDAAYKAFKNDPKVTCNYATALKSMGKTCDAYKIYKKADASCPGAADFVEKHIECK